MQDQKKHTTVGGVSRSSLLGRGGCAGGLLGGHVDDLWTGSRRGFEDRDQVTRKMT